VAIAVFEALLSTLRTYLFVDTTNRIDMSLGSEIIDHLLRLPLSYFEKRPVGEISTRVNELENILAEKERVVNDLRDKVATALFGFENNGLTIEIKNGKVYVSLDESLLFASGSWSVNAKGRDALIKLAKVLETNEDVNVLIEGHTDNVPFRGSGQVKDNWDLSVMRATAIVKIIVENSRVDPSRLLAAGRSEYHPVDNTNTAQGRAKNRRTEIILTPKLDELFQLLENQ
jgi:chemotaxis protein MotB